MPRAAAAKLCSPVVLVHGLFGFGRMRAGARTMLTYFHGIPEMLQAAGNRVLTPSLSPTAGVAARAAQLKAFLDAESPGEPVHVIGHSMGGLDTRYFISCLGGESRVLSLTTVGTPHRGSPVADWVVANLGAAAKPVCDLLGVPVQAFYDLTTSRCRALSAQMPDSPKVRYFSVAGRFCSHPLQLDWEIPHRIVRAAEGENDGVVSISSATFGEHTQIWPGDHMSLHNWQNVAISMFAGDYDRPRDYARLVGRLKEEGF